MARLLGPHAWGLYGMVLLVTILPETIIGGPLADSLIQRKDLRSGHVAGARVLHIGLALALFALAAGLTPFLAGAFGHTELLLLIPALSATFLVMAWAAPSVALLQREMRFRSIAMIDATGTATAAIVGIGLALAGWSVWALVLMEIARRCVRAAGFIIAAGLSRAFNISFSRQDLADLTHFNLTSLGAQLLTQADLAIPRLAVGAFMGAQALGYFNLAFRIFRQGCSLAIAPLNAIALPLISSVRDDRDQLHRTIRQAAGTATLVAFPAFMGAAAIAPAAIPFLLGEVWAPVVVPMQLMLLLGVRAASMALTGGILRGCGHPGLQVVHVGIGVLASCVLVPLATQFGLAAVAAAMLIKGAITWVIGALLVQRASGYSASNQIIVGWRNFLASSFMAGSVVLATPILANVLTGWSLLAVLLAGGVGLYAAALTTLNPRLARDVGRAILAKVGRLRRAGVAAGVPLGRRP
jgi:O-antigen/teichoic acid export membrane protein